MSLVWYNVIKTYLTPPGFKWELDFSDETLYLQGADKTFFALRNVVLVYPDGDFGRIPILPTTQYILDNGRIRQSPIFFSSSPLDHWSSTCIYCLTQLGFGPENNWGGCKAGRTDRGRR